MSNVLNRLHELEISARKIVLVVEHLRAENARLKKENTSLRATQTASSEKLGQVGMVNEMDKNDQWKDGLRSEIDECLQEIDHCIKLLNK